jgi:hypothetical protein
MNQYIFFTGAPGSRWSGVSQVFRDSLDGIDNSDLTPDRTYKHHLYSGHIGNYYGPGMQYGDWLDTEFGSREQWLAEIDRSYSDNTKPVKLVLSHNFAHYLDDLVKTFPESKLVLCYRRSNLCFDWWHAAGGWNISYPSYRWYSNDAKMQREIRQQNRAILDFVKKKNLTLEQPTANFFRQHFDVDRDFVFAKDVNVAVYG